MPSTPSPVSRDRATFAALLSAAYASAAVALLFLVIDAVRGDPFLTPSLMGSVVFLGADPSPDVAVRLDMVALYSLAHLAAFAVLGAAATAMALRNERLRRHGFLLPALIFAALVVGELIVEVVLFPGLVGAVGMGWVTLANAAAALVMGRFIRDALGDEDLPSLLDVFLGMARPTA